MRTTPRASRWALTLILLIGSASVAVGSSLTLDTPPGINVFNANANLISGAPVTGVTPQTAAFDAFHHNDANHDGVWNGPDSRLGAAGSYQSGLFGLYALSQSLGGHRATRQYARTRALLIIDDLVISTNDPAPPATISTSLSFHVSGQSSHFNSPVEPEYIEASLDMSVTIHGTVFNGKYEWFEGRNGITETVTGLGTQIAAGGFSESFSAQVTTGLATVPVNTPFTLRVEFTVSAGSGGASNNAYGGMVFDARNTAGFLPGAVIFNDLPEGYTANSQDAGIVNNSFDGSTVPVESTTWGGIKAKFDPDRP